VASLGLLVRQMEIWYQCYTQHRLNFIFPSGSFSLANAAHSPQALQILTLKRMANTFAFADGKAGKCSDLADFNAKANGK
jgi:hypothetical protein